jgi:hypothetical protein
LPSNVSGRTLTSVRARSIACVSLSCALVVVAACRRDPPMLYEDDAGPTDFGPGPDVDTDGDGMCDVTEYQRRTDPSNPDTDGDGYSDYVEAQNGTSALDPMQPDPHIMVTMSEAPQSTLDLPISFDEYPSGETITGEFVRVPLDILDDGTSALTFFTGAEATFASPMPNVHGGIAGPSFLGVSGHTLLVFNTHFAQVQPPRGCFRAYPFGYQIKTNTGAIWGMEPHWLVLVPAGESLGSPTAHWCGPTRVRCY